MKPPKGINTALFGIGGGAIVQATDECVKGGLKLPTLPLEIRNKLEKAYTTEAGGSFRNPIDLYLGKGELIQSTIKMIADLKQIDLLVIQIMFGFSNRDEPSLLGPYIDALMVIVFGKDKMLFSFLTLNAKNSKPLRRRYSGCLTTRI